MENESHFEKLSNELFTNILQHITTMQDLTSLCLTSHNIYHRTVPMLYHSWAYHGLTHSNKSLRNSLKTIIRRPNLARHIKVLELRDWGKVPKCKFQRF
jgi:hypothetical protein